MRLSSGTEPSESSGKRKIRQTFSPLDIRRNKGSASACGGHPQFCCWRVGVQLCRARQDRVACDHNCLPKNKHRIVSYVCLKSKAIEPFCDASAPIALSLAASGAKPTAHQFPWDRVGRIDNQGISEPISGECGHHSGIFLLRAQENTSTTGKTSPLGPLIKKEAKTALDDAAQVTPSGY